MFEEVNVTEMVDVNVGLIIGSRPDKTIIIKPQPPIYELPIVRPVVM